MKNKTEWDKTIKRLASAEFGTKGRVQKLLLLAHLIELKDKAVAEERQKERERVVEEIKSIGRSYCGVMDSNEKRRGYDIAFAEMELELDNLNNQSK